jgi:hypothetical protein
MGWMQWEPEIRDQDLFFICRLISLGLGLLGVAFTVLAARILLGPAPALLAGLMLVLDELHLIHSHFAMGDIPQAALMMGAVYFCARILTRERLNNYFWAGIFAGAAAAAKYFGGYIVLGILLAYVLSPKRRHLGLLLGAAGSLLGLIILAPAILFDPAQWSWEMYLEFFRQTRYSIFTGGDFWSWALFGIGHSYRLWVQHSVILPLLAIPSLVALFWRRQRVDWFLIGLIFPALFIVMIARASYLRDWDQILLMPLWYLCIARGWQKFWPWLQGKKWPRRSAAVGLALLLSTQAWFSIERVYFFQLPDTRKQAQAWLSQNLPPARPGQVFLVDITSPSAIAVNTSDHYFPKDRGYKYELIPIRPSNLCQETVGQKRPPQAAYALLHGIHNSPCMEWLSSRNPPLKEFELKPASWHNPRIGIYEFLGPILKAPWRPPLVQPQAWLEVDTANTVFSRRQVRELVVESKAVKRLLISKDSLELVGVSAQGKGALEVTQGFESQVIQSEAHQPRVIHFSPSGGYPYSQHFYRFELKADPGPILVRLLTTRAAVAAEMARAGDLNQACELWEQARKEGGELLGQDWLAWAQALQEQGQTEKAREILAEIQKRHPGLLEAVKQAASLSTGQPDKAQEALVQGLGVPLRALTWREMQLSWAAAQDTKGTPLTDPQTGEQVLAIPADAQGWTKFWVPGDMVGPYLRLRFWLKVEGGKAGAATVDAFGHFAHQVHGVLVQAEVDPQGREGFFPVELRLKLPMAPMRLEARIHTSAKARVWASRLEVLPDMAAWAVDLAEGIP